MNAKKNLYTALSAFILILLLQAACSFSVGPARPAQSPLLPTEAVSGATPTEAGAVPGAGNTAAPGAAQAAPTQAATLIPPIPVTSGGFNDSVRLVAQHVRPAVVQITNQQTQQGPFNQPFTIPTGVGSGVIYDSQGHILTNNHVVEGAEQLLVSLPDGRSFQGKLIGADPQTDLAVVQISGDNLPVAQLGDSSQLQVGDWVVAIGNALALPGGPTVSVGVVSALGRSVQEPGSQTSNQAGPLLFDLVQTDAPINPGNSGGPLVNLAGQVIGINTLVAGQAETGVQAQGIGFAISTSSAKPIAGQLVATGHVVHPYLGIFYQALNPALAARLNIRQTQGVLIGDVAPGSPAEKAGLLANDVITAIDNQPLKEESDLGKFLNAHKPGDTVTLSVTRDGQQGNVKVTLGTMPSQ